MSLFDRRISRATFGLLLGLLITFNVTAAYLGAGISAPWFVLALFCIWRLHDLGRSGKWVLLVLALQVLGMMIAFSLVPRHQMLTTLYFADVLVLPLLVWLGSTPGEPVSNGWGGPPPSGIGMGRN